VATVSGDHSSDGRLPLIADMPTISVFYGVVIQVFASVHPPPHFHAMYAEHVT
jgi:hypothetical protein